MPERVFALVPADVYAATGIGECPSTCCTSSRRWRSTGTRCWSAPIGMLLMADLFTSWLSGAMVASTQRHNHAVPRRARPRLGAAALERVGVPSRLFPDVAQPGTVLGALLEQGAGPGLGAAQVVLARSPRARRRPWLGHRLHRRGPRTFRRERGLLELEVPAPVISAASSATT
ncbi:MAG: hypothetical protein U0838_02950 [Chloroflexota bacterium]